MRRIKKNFVKPVWRDIMNRKKRTTRNCKGCGVEFEFVPWENKKYCRRECYLDYLKSDKWDNPMNHSEYVEKLRVPHTKEWNEKIGKAQIGKIGWSRGKKLPDSFGRAVSKGLRKHFGPIDDKWKEYKSLVLMETRRQPVETLEHFEKRGVWGKDKYHLDHIVSIKDGYERGIDYKEIANIKNLRFIPSYENNKKGARSGTNILYNTQS